MNIQYLLPPSGHSTESYNDSMQGLFKVQSLGSVVTFSCIPSLKHRTVTGGKTRTVEEQGLQMKSESLLLYILLYCYGWFVCLFSFSILRFLEDNNPVTPMFDLVLNRPVGPSVNVWGALDC